MFETKKSENKTRSGEIGLNIRTLASPNVGQDQCPEELASSVGMLHPLQMFYGNLLQLGKKSNLVKRLISNRVKNWCNVLSMERVTVYGHPPECHVTFGRGGPHIVW